MEKALNKNGGAKERKSERAKNHPLAPSLRRSVAPSLIALFTFLTGCAQESQDVIYRPSPQIMPQHIRKISLVPFANKTQQFALEDKLMVRVNTRFLTDGTYKVTSPEESDGVLSGEILRYIHLPVAYDANLVATQYKLDVVVAIRFVDRSTNQVLWEEPNFVGSFAYPVATQPGGMSEEQAREIVWEQLSKDIVKRTIKGFGSASGESQRKIAPVVPAEPPAQAIPTPAQ